MGYTGCSWDSEVGPPSVRHFSSRRNFSDPQGYCRKVIEQQPPPPPPGTRSSLLLLFRPLLNLEPSTVVVSPYKLSTARHKPARSSSNTPFNLSHQLIMPDLPPFIPCAPLSKSKLKSTSRRIKFSETALLSHPLTLPALVFAYAANILLRENNNWSSFNFWNSD
jgi:hypothetical protein